MMRSKKTHSTKNEKIKRKEKIRGDKKYADNGTGMKKEGKEGCI
jgi:hypothetical protein